MKRPNLQTLLVDSRYQTDSLLTYNRDALIRWTHRTYILRPSRFRYVSHRLPLTAELIINKASLSSGTRMVGRVDEGALHIGCYKLRDGRFMHVEGPWDDLCSVTLGGGLWETALQAESEGLMLLLQGELAERLNAVGRLSSACSSDPLAAAESFVIAPSPITHQFTRLLETALATPDLARRAEIAGELPGVLELLLPKILPLSTSMPKPRSQRRQLALDFERRLWDALPVRDSLPAIEKETCEALGLTRRSLQLAVSEHFGLSCEALQRVIRLNFAHLLLSDPDAPARNVTDAALAAGFRHLGRFSQQYRELFGQSPSATRTAAG